MANNLLNENHYDSEYCSSTPKIYVPIANRLWYTNILRTMALMSSAL